jgi:hypothetical protein
VYSEAQARREQQGRVKDVEHWREALRREGLTGDLEHDSAFRNDALSYLARTPSVLLAVQVVDMLDEINQAVSAVNELFDECRYLIYCNDEAPFDINSIPDCPIVLNLAPASQSPAEAVANLLKPISDGENLRSLISRDALLSNIFRTDRYTAGNS